MGRSSSRNRSRRTRSVRNGRRSVSGGRRGGARTLELPKAPSGIHGLDEITGGGLPRGRATLVCGGPGCGKTLFGVEFIIRGATEYGEPGVLMAFEETAEELAQNVASLGFDLGALERQKKVAIDYVRVERSEIEETGEYDLEGLFVRLQYAIDSVGAKRVVLDTIESLFGGLPDPAILRSELRRLFRWLKDRGLTVVLTGERGDGTLTRQGLEEYVSDCVIFLDQRITDQNATRRLRVVKYRGSKHGTNEYPFLIDERGISIMPLSSMGLAHRASSERISTGIARLDEMLGGKGYYRGSTILVSGTAGTGKTSLAALFARAACRRHERCLYFAFEESPDQIVRNMRSIGIDLEPYIRSGSLRIAAARPTAHGLEMHLVSMHRAVHALDPSIVVVDPMTSLTSAGTSSETRSMMLRLIDFLKVRGVTSLFTSLSTDGEELEASDVGISSLIDTWLLLSVVRSGGERNRTLSIVKSRGMAHSNQAAEYLLTGNGFQLLDTYVGPTGVLTGSARLAQEAADQETIAAHEEVIARTREQRDRRRSAIESRIAALQADLAIEDADAERAIREEARHRDRLMAHTRKMARSRQAFGAASQADERRP